MVIIVKLSNKKWRVQHAVFPSSSSSFGPFSVYSRDFRGSF